MMRRLRKLFFIIGAVSLLLGPSASGPADAQTPDDHGFPSVTAVVVGNTDPPPNPDGHSILGGRVSGDSRFRGVVINAEIVCRSEVTGEEEVVVARLTQPEGHAVVTFWADDDVTDGYGEVSQTDATRAFRDPMAQEVRVPGAPNAADVEVRIMGGRFHRLGSVVEVDLTLDIRVERLAPDPGVECETEPSRDVPVRIVFVLTADDDFDPTSGFGLVGVATRHGYHPDDRTSVARTACGLVSPYSTRVTLPEPPPDTPGEITEEIPAGRGPYHPCPPEGQTS